MKFDPQPPGVASDTTPDPVLTVDIWFDLSCPFTWRTANWLRAAAAQRDMVVRWHLMSLAVLNENAEVSDDYRAILARTVGPMRVLAAARHSNGADIVAPLYHAIGRRRHDDGRIIDRALIDEALEELGLSTALADAHDDASWDGDVARSHALGQAAVGEPAGSPIISFKKEPAFFGPVLSAAPADTDCLALLDSLAVTSRVSEFCEIKRPRKKLG